MPNFTYTTGIPATNDNPSDDQPDMLVNNDSNDSIWQQDHIGFNTNNGGLHKQVQIKNTSLIPVGLQNGFETIYAKAVGSPLSGELFYTRGSTGVEIQLTGPGTPSASANGYTFLPGALVLQWGFVNAPGSGPTAVVFPVAFSTSVFSVQLTPRNDGSHSAFTYYLDGAPTNSGFSYRASTSGGNTLFWMAIGK